MRFLVCGPRDWSDEQYVYDTLDAVVLPRITLLISGCADGLDAISCDWARSRGITVLPFPARWRKYRNSAGPIRNGQMIKEGQPDRGVAFRYSGEKITPGTWDMVKQLRKAGIKTVVLPYE